MSKCVSLGLRHQIILISSLPVVQKRDIHFCHNSGLGVLVKDLAVQIVLASGKSELTCLIVVCHHRCVLLLLKVFLYSLALGRGDHATVGREIIPKRHKSLAPSLGRIGRDKRLVGLSDSGLSLHLLPLSGARVGNGPSGDSCSGC